MERSLRKRLNIDVRAHLVRYASRAQSEEEFVNSAGRLLLDPKQRQHWLASWAPRIHSENSDTSPVPLDTDSEPPSTLPPDEAFAPSEAVVIPPWIDEEAWYQLREALSHELGPAAASLMETEAARSQSAAQLRERLHAHLETSEQRASFLRNTRLPG